MPATDFAEIVAAADVEFSIVCLLSDSERSVVQDLPRTCVAHTQRHTHIHASAAEVLERPRLFYFEKHSSRNTFLLCLRKNEEIM